MFSESFVVSVFDSLFSVELLFESLLATSFDESLLESTILSLDSFDSLLSIILVVVSEIILLDVSLAISLSFDLIVQLENRPTHEIIPIAYNIFLFNPF